jgi:hypothetical protein
MLQEDFSASFFESGKSFESRDSLLEGADALFDDELVDGDVHGAA